MGGEGRGRQRPEVGGRTPEIRVGVAMALNSAKDVEVYKKAYDVAMKFFRLSRKFPPVPPSIAARNDGSAPTPVCGGKPFEAYCC